MRKCFSIAFLLFWAGFGWSQSLYFCESYPGKRVPLDTSHQWRIRSSGGYIYLLFSQEKAFAQTRYQLLVAHQNDSNQTEIDTLSIFTQKQDSLAIYEWWTKGKGKFSFSIQDSAGQILAKDSLHLRYSYMEEITAKYRKSQLSFCDSSRKGKPIHTDTVFTLSPDGRRVFALLDNHEAIDEYEITVDIWKKEAERWKIFHSYNYLMLSEWTFSQIPLDFKQSGHYRIEIYTKTGIWINGGELTLKPGLEGNPK